MSDILIGGVESLSTIEVNGVETLVDPVVVTVVAEVAAQGPPGGQGPVGPVGPTGPTGPAGSTSGDLSYTHSQALPDTVWVVQHDLGKYPSVTVIDSGGSEVEGEITYTSANQLTLTFSAGFSGQAHLN